VAPRRCDVAVTTGSTGAGTAGVDARTGADLDDETDMVVHG